MLNDAKIRDAKPNDRPYKLYDAHQLFLYVTPTGSKLWRMNFKFDGTSKCLSLGAYPSTSLLEAREKSDPARKQLNEVIDPAVAWKMHIQEIGRASCRERGCKYGYIWVVAVS